MDQAGRAAQQEHASCEHPGGNETPHLRHSGNHKRQCCQWFSHQRSQWCDRCFQASWDEKSSSVAAGQSHHFQWVCVCVCNLIQPNLPNITSFPSLTRQKVVPSVLVKTRDSYWILWDVKLVCPDCCLSFSPITWVGVIRSECSFCMNLSVQFTLSRLWQICWCHKIAVCVKNSSFQTQIAAENVLEQDIVKLF